MNPGIKFCFIIFVKHGENNATDSRKQAIKKITVLKKKRTKLLSNSKNAMTMLNVDDFKRHGGGTVDGVFVTAGRVEPTMATKRNEL